MARWYLYNKIEKKRFDNLSLEMAREKIKDDMEEWYGWAPHLAVWKPVTDVSELMQDAEKKSPSHTPPPLPDFDIDQTLEKRKHRRNKAQLKVNWLRNLEIVICGLLP